jgi:hypothetical protein
MDEKAVVEYLLLLLEKNNVAVRTEALGGMGGGVCKLRDRTVVFVDSESSAAETAAMCAQAVNDLVETEKIYIVPHVRDFLEKHTLTG